MNDVLKSTPPSALISGKRSHQRVPRASLLIESASSRTRSITTDRTWSASNNGKILTYGAGTTQPMTRTSARELTESTKSLRISRFLSFSPRRHQSREKDLRASPRASVLASRRSQVRAVLTSPSANANPRVVTSKDCEITTININ